MELHIPNRDSTLRRSPHQRRAATEGRFYHFFYRMFMFIDVLLRRRCADYFSPCNGKYPQLFFTKFQSSRVGCVSRFMLPPDG